MSSTLPRSTGVGFTFFVKSACAPYCAPVTAALTASEIRIEAGSHLTTFSACGRNRSTSPARPKAIKSQLRFIRLDTGDNVTPIVGNSERAHESPRGVERLL